MPFHKTAEPRDARPTREWDPDSSRLSREPPNPRGLVIDWDVDDDAPLDPDDERLSVRPVCDAVVSRVPSSRCTAGGSVSSQDTLENAGQTVNPCEERSGHNQPVQISKTATASADTNETCTVIPPGWSCGQDDGCLTGVPAETTDQEIRKEMMDGGHECRTGKRSCFVCDTGSAYRRYPDKSERDGRSWVALVSANAAARARKSVETDTGEAQ